MTTATLDASMTRLENIKGNKHLYNKNKIAEAEALAAEALRMANEARLAAARLAEVKRTLFMFSNKLEKAEQSILKDVKIKIIPVVLKVDPTETADAVVEMPAIVENLKEETVEVVIAVDAPVEEAPVEEAPVEEAPVEEAPVEKVHVDEAPDEEAPGEEAPNEETHVEEAPVEETHIEEAPVEETHVEKIPTIATVDKLVKEEKQVKDFKADPPTASLCVVSKNLVNDGVVKVIEFTQPSPVTATKVVIQAPKESLFYTREAPAPGVAQETYQHDIVEEFLDSLGVDKMCGIDDDTLGFTDRQAPPPPAPKPEIPFENPTRIEYKSLIIEEFLHASSTKEEFAARQRRKLRLPPKQYQRALVNEEFADPFGVDHDDLVFCGKIADLCEPPEFKDYDEYEAYDMQYQ